MTSQPVDYIIDNGLLIDGTGAAARPADIAVTGDRIVGVGDLAGFAARRRIDAVGRVVSPGFIDVHTHDDRALLVDPLMACKVSQGVTTVVTGNCGVSLAPLATRGRPPAPLDLVCDRGEDFFGDFGVYLDRLDDEPPAVNALAQVGHSSLRVGAMDSLDRPATTVEISVMRGRLERALDSGAIGMSTGLFYDPAAAAPTSEVVGLLEVVEEAGGIHSTHMRDEGDRIVESLEETFAIGRRAGVPVVISHHKCTGTANHGRSTETLALIDEARANQPVGLDAYPYVAGSTTLDSTRRMDASRILVTWSEARPEAAGRDLADIASEMGCDLRTAADALQPAGGIFFMMSEEDVRRILAHPATMIGSDGLPHDEFPHPRLWGTFPRVLGRYARDEGLFSLEEAVHKMTALPAARFGLIDRGVVAVGASADLVVFDPETIIDTATFDEPRSAAHGIDLVIVNGREAWRDGESTGERPGRAIRLSELSIAQ